MSISAAIICGLAAGIVSMLGFIIVDPWFKKHKILDTTGVNNLHGLSGMSIIIACFNFAGGYE